MTHPGRRLTALLLAGALTAALAACEDGGTTPGQATGPDTGKVGGMPVTHFESGLKPDAPQPGVQVDNATDSQVDRIAIAAVADVSDYWTEVMPAEFGQEFQQLQRLLSYDANNDSVEICRTNTKGLVNAFYCPLDDTIAWDRGELLPRLSNLYGDVAPITVLAHEYGHAVQHRLAEKAGIPADGPEPPTIVLEQQADCFTGGYFRWIVDGKSQYFQVSTAEGLNAALSTMYLVRDRAGKLAGQRGAHGTSFDRTLAFQEGFTEGPKHCASYTEQLIKERTTQFKFADATKEGDAPVDASTVGLVKDSLDDVFQGTGAPQLSTAGGQCADGSGTPPASYCPQDNTIAVDLATLAQIGTPVDPQAEMSGAPSTGKGDFAAFASVASRYTLAVQKANGEPIDDEMSALRTACLTGSWAVAAMDPPSGKPNIQLAPGDVDEAILEMLQPRSLIGSNVNGDQVPSGFLRVEAFRTGYLDGAGACSSAYQ